MCVIKAAASGIFRHDSPIAEEIMEVHANKLDCAKMNDVKDVLRCFGVQSEYLRVNGSVDGIFFMQLTDRMLLVNVFDQNGAPGH